MSFAGLIEKTWRKNILFTAHFELTYACNLDCTFCYNERAKAERARALTDEEWCALLDDLADMAVMNLVLSGGEPLVHPGFFRIGAHARARGFVVRVKSNGHLLRGEVVTRLADEVDPFVVELSLHGATAETHDRQTQVVGSFARLLDNVRAAKDRVRIQLNTPFTAWNEGELDAMVALAKDLGVRHRIDPDITAKDDGDPAPLALTASRAGLARLFSLGNPHDAEPRVEQPCANDGDKQCGAGSASILVDPFGDVLPCVQWRTTIGNVRDTPIRALWSGGGFDGVRATLVDVKRALGGERDHCAGVAHQRTGDARATTPEAAQRREVRRSLPIIP